MDKNIKILKAEVGMVTNLVFFFIKKKQTPKSIQWSPDLLYRPVKDIGCTEFNEESNGINKIFLRTPHFVAIHGNSRQFMSDQNFRENHEKCFLCRISRRIEWYQPNRLSGSKSAPKWTFLMSRLSMDMFF